MHKRDRLSTALERSSKNAAEPSRRRFLAQSGLAAGSLVLLGGPDLHGQQPSGHYAPERLNGAAATRAPSFTFPSSAAPRLRKSFLDLSRAELQTLADAYQKLKNLTHAADPNLPGPDNRYWINQANVHADNCDGGPNEVHGRWFFLPWHRSYLYFYERILASLTSDATNFALPYWDWTSDPAIPRTSWQITAGRSSSFFDQTSALYDPNRGPDPSSKISDDPDTFQYVVKNYIENTLLKKPTFEEFGSYNPNGPFGPMKGELEQHPHDFVHGWVGKSSSPFRDMGNLQYAARDLLFFLHHANVDRLWSKWMADPSHALPSKTAHPEWYGHTFNLFDETGATVSVTVDDTFSGLMNVSYQESGGGLIVKSTPDRGRVLGTAPLTVADAAAPAPGGRRTRLRVTVAAPLNAQATYRVYVNKPDASVQTGLNDPHYVGSIRIVAKREVAGHAGINEHAEQFPLSVPAELLKDVPSTEKPKITLVPVGRSGTVPDASVAAQRVKLVSYTFDTLD
jgi:polyphenol oxidase